MLNHLCANDVCHGLLNNKNNNQIFGLTVTVKSFGDCKVQRGDLLSP